jgi:hypothetical protein
MNCAPLIADLFLYCYESQIYDILWNRPEKLSTLTFLPVSKANTNKFDIFWQYTYFPYIYNDKYEQSVKHEEV